MKWTLLLLIGLCISNLSFSQTEVINFVPSISNFVFSTDEWGFKSEMTTAAKALDDCANDPDGCALKDMEVEEEKTTVLQQMLKAGISGAYTQKTMVSFEKMILKGKGKKLLNRIDVVLAFEKYSGYTYSAMSNRMNIYIKKLSEKSQALNKSKHKKLN